jgi:7-cyano-7-deazaguanine synthase
VLVSLALSYAVSARASSVAVAVIRDDLGRYSCTNASFWYTLRDLAATAGDVSVSTPLMYLDKAAVMDEGRRLGVDFSRTYSCVVGNETHCGRCYQCEARRNAAKRIGLPEPLGFYQRDAAPITPPEQPVFAD